MRELFFFAAGASISLTIFTISLIELIFTVKRRKAAHELDLKVKEMKAAYNSSINKLVLEDESKLEEVEKQTEQVTSATEAQKEQLTREYQEKLEAITKDSAKALESAQAKAKKLEKEARVKADEYMKNRQQEVEEELMNLVISVTKKVLPEGITYKAHKELVMQALHDVKLESTE